MRSGQESPGTDGLKGKGQWNPRCRNAANDRYLHSGRQGQPGRLARTPPARTCQVAVGAPPAGLISRGRWKGAEGGGERSRWPMGWIERAT